MNFQYSKLPAILRALISLFFFIIILILFFVYLFPVACAYTSKIFHIHPLWGIFPFILFISLLFGLIKKHGKYTTGSKNEKHALSELNIKKVEQSLNIILSLQSVLIFALTCSLIFFLLVDYIFILHLLSKGINNVNPHIAITILSFNFIYTFVAPVVIITANNRSKNNSKEDNSIHPMMDEVSSVMGSPSKTAIDKGIDLL